MSMHDSTPADAAALSCSKSLNQRAGYFCHEPKRAHSEASFFGEFWQVRLAEDRQILT